MALVTCSDCGREISSRAPACPHCGCPTDEGVPAASLTRSPAAPVQRSLDVSTQSPQPPICTTARAGGAPGREQQWWLSRADEAEGPFVASAIVAGLRNGSIPVNALACPVDGQQWKPVSEWAEFAEAIPILQAEPVSEWVDVTRDSDGRSAVAPRRPLSAGQFGDSFLTNSRLPTMANCICVYAILVSPILWLFGECSGFAAGSTYRPGSGSASADAGLTALSLLGSLATAIVLFVGGLRLRGLRRSGVPLLKAGLWASLGLTAFLILAHIMVAAAAAAEDFTETDINAGTAMLLLVLFALVVAVTVVEIVALVWLSRNAPRLPLTDD